jgi:NAD(P)-dependent dehydrogenase (short-subunit alcohol dehydrogenase family)
MGLLDGRRAIVTGGGSGIGRATGQNLVVDGGMTLHGAGVDGLLERFRPFSRILPKPLQAQSARTSVT